jgi:hypothetical protein
MMRPEAASWEFSRGAGGFRDIPPVARALKKLLSLTNVQSLSAFQGG